MSLRAGATAEQARWRVRQLAVARMVSVAGSQAAELALVYQIYAVTGSGAWVAAALFGSIGLGGLLGPISGWIADRFDRRRVMVVSEVSAGVAYAALVFAHAPGVLLTGVLVATVLGAPFRAASAAAIPNLVSVDDLAWANAQLGAASNIALVAGPLLGGGLLAVAGAGLVFAVNAGSFAISGVLITLTRGSFGGQQHHVAAEGDRMRELFAGFRFIVTHRQLAPLALASALAYASFGTALVVDPALSRYFHAGSVGYGLLTTLWGAGAVAGALVAGKVVTVPRARQAVIVGMAAMAVSLGSIPLLPNFPLIVAAGALGGAGSGFVFIPWLLLIQHHSTDAVRGRVVAAAEAFDQIALLAGMVCAVPVIAYAQPHHAYALAGLLLLTATGIVALSRPEATVAPPGSNPVALEEA